jgi:hypothetical protein
MGKDSAEVNLVAGDGDEAGGEGEAVGKYEYEDEYEDGYEYECEYEGLWVGTIGATEVPERTDESSGITADQEPAQSHEGRTERGHDFQIDECSEGERTGDEQWDLGTDQPDQRAGGTRDPLHGPPRRPPSSRVRPPHRAEASRPRIRARSREASDQQWEEARHSAWLRQLLSDDSSGEDEDEERYRQCW